MYKYTKIIMAKNNLDISDDPQNKYNLNSNIIS